jgi:hypothetical protein
MNADSLFSVGITVAACSAVAASVYLVPGARGIPRSRVAVLVKILSSGGSRKASDAEGDWGCRLQSFGDLVYAFSDAMSRESVASSHRQSTPRRGCYKRPSCLGTGTSLTSSQVR